MSIDDATPEEWNEVNMNSQQKKDEDKPFIDVKGVDDLNVDRVYKVKGNFEKSYSIQNNEVKDLYLDSINYEKYRINLPRTAVTGQW